MKLSTLKFSFLFLTCLLTRTSLAQTSTELDHYLQQVQRQHQIPGLAAAIVRDGVVIYQASLGLSSIQPEQAVSTKTVFPLFSSTKIFSVVAAFQAIEAGKLKLDDELSRYLTDLPAAWRDRQIRHLLSHASGLPDIVEFEDLSENQAKQAVYSRPIKFPAGQEFDYNQTNFWLLNRIFQRVYGQTLNKFILAKQFPAAPASVFFESDASSNHSLYSPGYNNTGTSLTKRNWHFPAYNFGAAGLNLSLDEFIRWNQQFDKAAFLGASSLAQLTSPFAYSKPTHFAHGWEIIDILGVKSYGFSGGMATAFRKVPDKKLTVILLCNAMLIPGSGKPSLNQVVNHLIEEAENIPTTK